MHNLHLTYLLYPSTSHNPPVLLIPLYHLKLYSSFDLQAILSLGKELTMGNQQFILLVEFELEISDELKLMSPSFCLLQLKNNFNAS